MSKTAFGFIFLLMFGYTIFSQERVPAGGNSRPNSEPKANVLIESKANCVQITDFKYKDSEITVRLKNICIDNITAVLVRTTGLSKMHPRFPLKPDEEREISKYAGAGGGFILEAVLFENGDGDGDVDRLKALREVFAGSRSEYLKIIEIINPYIENTTADPKTIIREVKKQINALPDFFFDTVKTQIGGATLLSGKGTAQIRIADIEANANSNNIEFVIEELKKLKTEFEKTIETYPNVPNP